MIPGLAPDTVIPNPVSIGAIPGLAPLTVIPNPESIGAIPGLAPGVSYITGAALLTPGASPGLLGGRRMGPSSGNGRSNAGIVFV